VPKDDDDDDDDDKENAKDRVWLEPRPITTQDEEIIDWSNEAATYISN
jgi:hypothetical protein